MEYNKKTKKDNSNVAIGVNYGIASYSSWSIYM